VLCIPRLAKSKLKAAHDAALPCEACGFLLGTNEGSVCHVVDIALPSGAAGSFNGFELADHEISRVTAYAEDRGLKIVAIFHSHPGGYAALSERDLAAIRFSQWPWVLITRRPPNDICIQAFAAGTAQPMDVRLVDDVSEVA
jgi:proteasome lid subunit RPN8/RPN11